MLHLPEGSVAIPNIPLTSNSLKLMGRDVLWHVTPRWTTGYIRVRSRHFNGLFANLDNIYIRGEKDQVLFTCVHDVGEGITKEWRDWNRENLRYKGERPISQISCKWYVQSRISSCNQRRRIK